ncbi:MAG: class I SAM-dependent methyltransferase [Bacteriovoracaceae bacterium]|nr:class I SAM-dependent methyltransferase [Bacteriovoracaceae bacterium]
MESKSYPEKYKDYLFWEGDILKLDCKFYSPQSNPLFIDFIDLWGRYDQAFKGKNIYNENLIKALGLSRHHPTLVFDATCGLGKDTLFMLYAGAHVIACEKSPILFALLENAHHRAMQKMPHIFSSLQIFLGDSVQILRHRKEMSVDAIYLDPMYEETPLKRKSLPKKNMQILSLLLTPDENINELGDLALSCAKDRVVIKRSLHALPFFTQKQMTASYKGKTTRYDMYKILS